MSVNVHGNVTFILNGVTYTLVSFYFYPGEFRAGFTWLTPNYVVRRRSPFKSLCQEWRFYSSEEQLKFFDVVLDLSYYVKRVRYELRGLLDELRVLRGAQGYFSKGDVPGCADYVVKLEAAEKRLKQYAIDMEAVSGVAGLKIDVGAPV